MQNCTIVSALTPTTGRDQDASWRSQNPLRPMTNPDATKTALNWRIDLRGGVLGAHLRRAATLRAFSPVNILTVAAVYIGCVVNAVWGCARTAIVLVATLILIVHVTRALAEWVKAPGEQPPKYARSAMTPGDIDRILRKLDGLVADHAVHRDPNLTLTRLAHRMGVATNDLSQALNCQRGGFREWLADTRVADVQKTLMSTRGEINLLHTAFDAGFNSKSAFYDAFRRVTGLTPLAWRVNVVAVH